mmetsp:Transcript_678/g.727  ORF Transcript_678/g.727 Transcript_678/m.727 type:complete len:108 (+) Transcript_678:140-463(+)
MLIQLLLIVVLDIFDHLVFILYNFEEKLLVALHLFDPVFHVLFLLGVVLLQQVHSFVQFFLRLISTLTCLRRSLVLGEGILGAFQLFVLAGEDPLALIACLSFIVDE